MNPLFKILSIIIILFFVNNIYSEQKETDKIRAVFIHQSLSDLPIPDKSADGFSAYLEGMNVNALFLPSAILTNELVSALHKRNISVYAEIALFIGLHYWQKVPNTRPVNRYGKPIEKQEWYAGICPNQESVRTQKLETIKKIISTYNIDGLWLDFIRYPVHWEVKNPIIEETCFCDVCLQKFSKDSGISYPSNLKTTQQKADWILLNYTDKWYKWRAEQITSFVKQTKDIISQTNPKVKLGLFGVPWRYEDYDNAIYRVVAQDYKNLSEYVDIFSPMVYHQMCNKPVEWIGEIDEYIYKQTNKPVLPIIQANDITQDEFEKAIEQTNKENSIGVIIFTLERVVNDGKIIKW